MHDKDVVEEFVEHNRIETGLQFESVSGTDAPVRLNTYVYKLKYNHSGLCIGWHDLSRLCLAIHNVWYCGCRECIVSNEELAMQDCKDITRIVRQGNVSDAVSQVVKVLGSRSPSVIPLYTAVDRLWRVVCRFVSWHSAQSVTRRI